MRRVIVLLALAGAILPAQVAAHPGEHQGSGLTHLIGDPFHLTLLLLTVICVVLLFPHGHNHLQKRESNKKDR